MQAIKEKCCPDRIYTNKEVIMIYAYYLRTAMESVALLEESSSISISVFNESTVCTAELSDLLVSSVVFSLLQAAIMKIADKKANSFFIVVN